MDRYAQGHYNKLPPPGFPHHCNDGGTGLLGGFFLVGVQACLIIIVYLFTVNSFSTCMALELNRGCRPYEGLKKKSTLS